MKNNQSRIQQIEQTVHQAGYKLTPQRMTVVSVLLAHHEEHLSAEQLFMQTKEVAPEIGLATIYRTLELLAELHILTRVNLLDDGVIRYDLSNGKNQHLHHHLHCRSCGRIIEVPDDLLQSVEEIISRRYDFLIEDHQLTFQGLCAQCQKTHDSGGH